MTHPIESFAQAPERGLIREAAPEQEAARQAAITEAERRAAASLRPTLAEPHPEAFSVQAAENGDYPALCHDPAGLPCEASAAAWAAEQDAPAAEARESAAMEARWPEYEAEAGS